MFLLTRFQDLIGKDFWKKAKSQRLRDNIGFFAFWILVLALVVSVVVVVDVNRFANEAIDDFRRDFVDFEVRMEDGTLSTQGLPDPFVLSEFLNSDEKIEFLGVDQEIISEFKEGFRQGLSEELDGSGQELDIEDIEVVLDTKGEMGITIDTIDSNKLGFYFLAQEFIVTDPTALSDEEKVAVESYEGSENFKFDKEYLIDIWDKYSTTVSLIVFAVSFGLYIFFFMFVRFITAFLWAGLIWLVGSMMKFEFDYFEAYGVALVYLVPITVIEVLVGITVGWLPFTTIGLVLLFAILHGSGVGSSVENSDKPKVIEGE